MESKQAMRGLAAAAIAALGFAAASLLGASPAAALVGLLAGIAAYGIAPSLSPPDPPARPAEPPAEEEAAPALPGIAELLGAVEDPLLIVRERRVIAANDGARRLLGAHIEGVDVRLAIRHPAAAERLVGPAADMTDPDQRTELIGLGDPGRHWTMTVTRLGEGSRLVRLTDQSQARAAEQMRVDFVANASHELRTPLATLLGFIETLQDDAAGGEAKTRGRFLKIMSDEASRMRNLVDDLMSLSRIEAERFTIPRDPVELVSLIDEVKDSIAQLIESREASVVVENDAGDARVLGDRPQLAQMITNLVVNALKYGRTGIPVRIRLQDAGGDMIRLSVIDEGEGIAPEHLPRLTERFYRVDPGRSRQVGGTGLGLAIVKHIVLRHRGRLDIRSELGVGTEVRVYLPRAQ